MIKSPPPPLLCNEPNKHSSEKVRVKKKGEGEESNGMNIVSGIVL